MVFIIILGRPWSGLSFQSGSGLSRTGSPIFCMKLCSAHATSSLPRGVVQLCAIYSDLSKQTYTTLPHYTVYFLGHLAHYWESSACHRLIFIQVRTFSFFSEYDFFNSEHDSKNMAFRNQNHHEPRNRCSHSNKHTVHPTFPLFSFSSSFINVK